MGRRTKENKKIRKTVRNAMEREMKRISRLPFRRRLVWAIRILRGK